MNGLSLCAGGGGLDLALEIAFDDYKTIAAVENNPEAAKRFSLRYPETKVFENVMAFSGRPLHGLVDCVAAGWPCQPHSVAGKRKGTADERWIWGDIARILRECGAPLFFGENVSGLLRDADRRFDFPEDLGGEPDESTGGMGTVLRDLAESGFVSCWLSLRASDVGASHGRRRVFVLGVAHDFLARHGKLRPAFRYGGRESSGHDADGRSEGILADAAGGTGAGRSAEDDARDLQPHVPRQHDAGGGRGLLADDPGAGGRLDAGSAEGPDGQARRAVDDRRTPPQTDRPDAESGRMWTEGAGLLFSGPPSQAARPDDGDRILADAESSGARRDAGDGPEARQSARRERGDLADAAHSRLPPAGSAGGPPAEAALSLRPDGSVDDAQHSQRRAQDLARNRPGQGVDAGGEAAGSARGAGGILADAGRGPLPLQQESQHPAVAGREHADRFHGERLADAPDDGRRLREDQRAVPQPGSGPLEPQPLGQSGELADAGGPRLEERGVAPGESHGSARPDPLRLHPPRVDPAGTVGHAPQGHGAAAGSDLRPGQGESRGTDGSLQRNVEDPARPPAQAGGGRSGRRRRVRATDRTLDDADSGQRLRVEPCAGGRSVSGDGRPDVADAGSGGRRRVEGEQPGRGSLAPDRSESLPLFAPGPSDPRWPHILRAHPLVAPALSPVEIFLALALQQSPLDVSQEAEPGLRRVAHGVAQWLHERRPRLQLLGNGVVPLQAAVAFTELARRLGILE